MRNLHFLPLGRDQVAQALPLVQAIRPQLSLDDWRAYVRRFPTQSGDCARSGIATVQDDAGVILGLFAYRVDSTAPHGKTLFVDHFVALDIISPTAVTAELADGMERIAHCLGCHAVHTAVSCTDCPRGRDLIERLRAFGHRLERFQLCKPLPAPG